MNSECFATKLAHAFYLGLFELFHWIQNREWQFQIGKAARVPIWHICFTSISLKVDCQHKRDTVLQCYSEWQNTQAVHTEQKDRRRSTEFRETGWSFHCPSWSHITQDSYLPTNIQSFTKAVENIHHIIAQVQIEQSRCLARFTCHDP